MTGQKNSNWRNQNENMYTRVKKTTVLVFTKKEQTRQECIKIDQENLEGVEEVPYLGSKIK